MWKQGILSTRLFLSVIYLTSCSSNLRFALLFYQRITPMRHGRAAFHPILGAEPQKTFLQQLHTPHIPRVLNQRTSSTLHNIFPNCHFVVGAFAGIDNAIVDDHPLLVTYDAVAEGAVKKTKENHLRNQSELVLLVHRPCPSDKPFTCNRRVVVADVFGHSTGRYPHTKQILAFEALPAGAPNGGSRSFFPGKVVHLLIGRYTLKHFCNHG